MRHQDIRENATIETPSHNYVESLITGRKTIVSSASVIF